MLSYSFYFNDKNIGIISFVSWAIIGYTGLGFVSFSFTIDSIFSQAISTAYALQYLLRSVLVFIFPGMMDLKSIAYLQFVLACVNL